MKEMLLKLFKQIYYWKIRQFYLDEYVSHQSTILDLGGTPFENFAEYMYFKIDALEKCHTNLKEFYKLFK